MIREYLTRSWKAFSKKTWRRIVIAFIVVVAPVIIFAELAEQVSERETLAYDEAILLAVNRLEAPFLDSIAVAITQLGGLIGMVLLVAMCVVVLWLHRRRARAVFIVLSVTGAGLLNLLLKSIYQRDRPELWERLVTENTFSFPSGHAMASSALAFGLMVAFWHTRYRWIVVIGAGIYMVAVAFTRLYLGVHYPTDILAGWIVSGMWVSAVTVAVYYRKLFIRSRKSKV